MNDFDEAHRVDPRLWPELYDDQTALAVDGLDAQPVGHDPDPAVLGQVQHRGSVGGPYRSAISSSAASSSFSVRVAATLRYTISR